MKWQHVRRASILGLRSRTDRRGHMPDDSRKARIDRSKPKITGSVLRFGKVLNLSAIGGFVRTIMVAAKRSVKLELLSDKYLAMAKSALGKDSKEKEFTFSAAERPFEVPASYAEMLSVLGEQEVFEKCMKQIRIECGNTRADEILAEVCDPAKSSKAGKTIQVSI